MSCLLLAAKCKFARTALETLARAEDTATPARRLADFGVSLLSASLYSGRRIKRRSLPQVLEQLARSLGPAMEHQDISKIDMPDALELYVRVVNEQSIRKRRSLISWLLELDLYIRARVKERQPIPKSKLPWPPDNASDVDVNLATHEEYFELLRRIDRLWDVRDNFGVDCAAMKSGVYVLVEF
jgi:hypothetical protein